MPIRATLLALASLAATSHATISVMDTPLPFSIYQEGTECKGSMLANGIITRVKTMEEDGSFCENTIQFGDNGEEITVYTKVVFSTCDAVSGSAVDLDAYSCKDEDCSSCTDLDSIPVPAKLILPEYSPLPETYSCWGVQAVATGVTVLNRFDMGADTKGVEDYWKLYTENSCIKDNVQIVTKRMSSASTIATTGAVIATTMALVAAFL